MDKQKFNRMHDMLLEPPVLDDEDGEQDETDRATLLKQQQRDLEDYLAEKYYKQQEGMQ